jgi:hypothetical protein
MTKEQQDIYDAYFELFASKGWNLYLTTVKEDKEVIMKQGVYDSKTELELGKAQGALYYLDVILGLENRIENMYDEARRESEDEGKDVNYIEKIEDSE